MNITGFLTGSNMYGPGYNFVLFLDDNQKAHRRAVDTEDLFHTITACNYTGFSITGYNPMESIRKMVKSEFDSFIVMIKDLKLSGLCIICYTDYSYEQLKLERQLKLLSLVDILIQCPFDSNKKIEMPYNDSSSKDIVILTDRGRNAMSLRRE